MRATNSGYKIVCQDSTATIYLYDVIGQDFMGGIGAKQFADDLNGIKGVKQIDLRINSPGGSVFEGNTMFNLLKAHGANISVYVDGLAASIASVIAMAGDKIEMAANSMMMIHDPSGLSFGTAEDHRKLADLLDKLRDTIVNTYVSRSGGDAEEIAALMSAETWLTAQEAVDAGLADNVGEDAAIAACAIPETLKYRNVPKVLVDRAPTPAAPLTDEQKLRQEILSLRTKTPV